MSLTEPAVLVRRFGPDLREDFFRVVVNAATRDFLTGLAPLGQLAATGHISQQPWGQQLYHQQPFGQALGLGGLRRLGLWIWSRKVSRLFGWFRQPRLRSLRCRNRLVFQTGGGRGGLLRDIFRSGFGARCR